MEATNYSQTKAATIIQRNFRKYLHRKGYKPECLNKLEISENLKKLGKYEDANTEKQNNSQEIQDVRKELKSFYTKISENSGRCKYVNDLIISIDETLERLEGITSLETFKQTNRNICIFDENILNEAKRKHEEKLKYFDLQWWEKL